MDDPLAPLSTDPNDFLFLDVETRSYEDVTIHGAFRHNAKGRVTVLAYAVGDADVKDWCLQDWTPSRKLNWVDAPDDLKAAIRRVKRGEMWIVAWNAQFEVLALSRGMEGDVDEG
jgi:hypothetical protein